MEVNLAISLNSYDNLSYHSHWEIEIGSYEIVCIEYMVIYNYSHYRMCVLGQRLLKNIAIDDCNKSKYGPLYNIFCNSTTKICDEYFMGKNNTHNYTRT